MVKEGYFPTEKKRFEIRGDVSKERVENLKIFYLVLQEKLPQVTIGFGMYGSLTKGKVLREDSWLGLRKGNMNNTDVDLAIYYDDDQLRKHCASVGTDVDRYRAYTENAHFLVQDDTNGKEARHRYVDKLVSQLWYNHNVSQSREMWLEKHVTGISRSGSDSIFARVRQLMDHDALPNIDGNDGSDTFTLKRSVARAFHLDFMGGLKSYRQDFVRHLLTLPKEEGERMWNYVAQLITSWERLGRIPDAIQGQFPQTLDDAARYYVVHTVSGE